MAAAHGSSVSNQVSHFGELLLRKSLTTDRPPALLTHRGGVAESHIQTMRNDQIVTLSECMKSIA
jgi:hypothetical protein